MTYYRPPGWFTKNLFNPAVAALTQAGVSFWGSRILRVKGRTSGEWRSAPVNLLTYEGKQYLVAPRGQTQWVRNLRVSGTGELLLGFGVHLAEHDVGVGRAGLLERRAEGTARATPGRPPVDQDDVVVEQGLLERCCGQCLGGHEGSFSAVLDNTSGGINPQWATGIPDEANGNGGAGDRVDQSELPRFPAGRTWASVSATRIPPWVSISLDIRHDRRSQHA